MPTIAHLDLDAFFAAVELHRRPELRGKPLVVGGDPNGRGVVATASYAARAFGIRSAMSCAEAKRRCPHAAFVVPDMPAYREWSERVWDVVATLADRVEQVGIDEGYIELRDPGPEHALAIQRAVRERVRLSCSMGVASSKVVAKIASDRRKPGGVTIVQAGKEAAFLAPLAVRLLPGIGPRTEERLLAEGIETLGQLASSQHPLVVGSELQLRAKGIDPRVVQAEASERVSISQERTFPEDVRDAAELAAYIGGWSTELADSLVDRKRAARTITIKIRYPDFATITRAQTLSSPTFAAEDIAEAGLALLDRALAERRPPVRLLGLGVTGLLAEWQLSLFSRGPTEPNPSTSGAFRLSSANTSAALIWP